MEIFHPGAQQRYLQQLNLGDKAGQSYHLRISHHGVKDAAVVAHIENGGVPGDAFMTDDSYLHTGTKSNYPERPAYISPAGTVFHIRPFLANQPFHESHRNG